jgi:hypothetical protein
VRPSLCWCRIQVIAAMWMAWLMRRLPRSESRRILRFPEDTPAGAVPLQEAKWSRPGKRDTSAMSPVMVLAMTGPTPKT